MEDDLSENDREFINGANINIDVNKLENQNDTLDRKIWRCRSRNLLTM